MTGCPFQSFPSTVANYGKNLSVTTMADIFLIVSITVAFFILLVVAVYLLVYYQHPDDRNEAYFPKIVVVVGIMLAGATALLLPLDVANNAGYSGT
jgi:LMBR1 domain-containing protein 1